MKHLMALGVQSMFRVFFCRCCAGNFGGVKGTRTQAAKSCVLTSLTDFSNSHRTKWARTAGRVGAMSLFRSMLVLLTANNNSGLNTRFTALSTGIWWPAVLVIPGQGGTNTLAPLSGIHADHAVNLQRTGWRNSLWVDPRDHCNAESHFPNLYCATASLRWSAIQQDWYPFMANDTFTWFIN